MNASSFGNLQIKVTWIFLLLSLVPLGTVSVFAIRTANEVIASIMQNQLENVADEKQTLLERWLAERRADVQVLAGSPTVRRMDPSEAAPFLSLVEAQYGVYRRFILRDEEGALVFDSRPPLDAEKAYRRAEREESLASGVPAMSRIELAADGRESVFSLAVGIRDEADRLRGSLCAVISTESVLKRVLRVRLGATGECYLVDKHGTFLAHKSPERILRESIAESGSFANLADGSRKGGVYTDYRGVEVLGASRPVSGTDWFLVVEQDRDEAFATAHLLERNVWIVIALTVVVAIALSALLAWYVASPIRKLSEAARILSQGEFEKALVDLETGRRDEIGALCTAFRHMADQLKDRQSLLETRVGWTVAELEKTDAKLRGTIEAAERSERLAALGRLASGVAHEIRTPLTSLKLFLQSIQEDVAISCEMSEDHQVAMRQIARIERTINHFLDFARPQDPVLKDLDFAELIEDVLEVIRPRANQQDVEILKDVAAELPRFRGDGRQLAEGILNLLVNALDAMPEGGKLSIAVAPGEMPEGASAGASIRIEVSDTGPGIDEKDLDRLFEPFFTTKAAGSGLGLTILKGTIERHAGTIAVHTEPGAGTRFSICLPVIPAEEDADGKNPDSRQR